MDENDSNENSTAGNVSDDASGDAAPEVRASRIFRNNPPYGDAIMGALATGDLNEMRTAAGRAESWLSDAEAEVSRVRAALGQLRTAIRHLEADSSH